MSHWFIKYYQKTKIRHLHQVKEHFHCYYCRLGCNRGILAMASVQRGDSRRPVAWVDRWARKVVASQVRSVALAARSGAAVAWQAQSGPKAGRPATVCCNRSPLGLLEDFL